MQAAARVYCAEKVICAEGQYALKWLQIQYCCKLCCTAVRGCSEVKGLLAIYTEMTLLMFTAVKWGVGHAFFIFDPVDLDYKCKRERTSAKLICLTYKSYRIKKSKELCIPFLGPFLVCSQSICSSSAIYAPMKPPKEQMVGCISVKFAYTPFSARF